MLVQIDPGWAEILSDEFNSGYMKKLLQELAEDRAAGIQIYPPEPLIFNAFNQTPFSKVKVIILGQDPYHGPNQAHGLAFSVQKHVKFPPSLNNIFKELENDIPGFVKPENGDLSHWAHQGVLLLNTTLTVEEGRAASHHKRGWELFTDHVISKLSEKKQDLIFLLWGKHAQSKKQLIDTGKHYILEAAHPSPLSAHSGFFGCRHFSKANQILKQNGQKPIDWMLNAR
jgi:uracil-DNA glycosylase